MSRKVECNFCNRLEPHDGVWTSGEAFPKFIVFTDDEQRDEYHICEDCVEYAYGIIQERNALNPKSETAHDE